MHKKVSVWRRGIQRVGAQRAAKPYHQGVGPVDRKAQAAAAKKKADDEAAKAAEAQRVQDEIAAAARKAKANWKEK